MNYWIVYTHKAKSNGDAETKLELSQNTATEDLQLILRELMTKHLYPQLPVTEGVVDSNKDQQLEIN